LHSECSGAAAGSASYSSSRGPGRPANADALEALAETGIAPLRWYSMGEGFTWETQDKARDIAAAEAAWDKVRELLLDQSLGLIVLDELNIALRYDYLPLDLVIAELTDRRPELHVVVTGRNAKPALIEAADLVTEMGLVKHHFEAGVKAQEGIEF
jgi:cob(I)alamin adenosyltransferase